MADEDFAPAAAPPAGVSRTDERVCPTCHLTATGTTPTPMHEQLGPSTWTWCDPVAAAALRTCELGAILRAYRRVHALTQAQMADRLGYDKTYVSMLETGRRRVQDVCSRRQIAGILAIPPHLLGVTDPADSDHVAMIAFAESTIRLADLARAAGRAADAVNELWPLVARLETRAADGRLEPDILDVLGRAWTSLGVCLGTVLPEERLAVAAGWTGKGVAAAKHLDDPRTLFIALAMHGNELRKSGRQSRAVTVLERAASFNDALSAVKPEDRPDAGTAWALLARAAAEAGHHARFAEAVTACHNLIEGGRPGSLLDPFTFREIHLRGLLDLGDLPSAVAVADSAPLADPPSVAWEIIERITRADVLEATGERNRAQELLGVAVEAAARHRLPHQIQRAVRTAHRGGLTELVDHGRTALGEILVRPIRRD
jgi:transcriptional regulator with XRE-family HTH domain